MIDSIEGTQFGRGYVGSYESPWVSRYCDLVGRWDVLHGGSIWSAWWEVGPTGRWKSHSFPYATSQTQLFVEILSCCISFNKIVRADVHSLVLEQRENDGT